MVLLIIVFMFFAKVFSQFADFEVPEVTMEVFTPKGLRVSIPDQKGIEFFAFHGKLNEKLKGQETGTFSKDIAEAKNGRWTFYDPEAQLKIGDTLHYRINVDYFNGRNKLGYTKYDQTYQVDSVLPQEPVTPEPPYALIVYPIKGCRKPTTEIEKWNSSIYCSYQTVLDENFDRLDLNVWTPEIRFAGQPHYEFVLYEDRPETLSVKDSKLVIRPVLTEEIYGPGFVTSSQGLNLGEKCTGSFGTEECSQTPDAFLILPPVVSAQITSKRGFAFKYGRIEIKAKFPSGDWIYPEITLRPKYEKYGPGLQSGEIKIAFIEGNYATSNVLYGGIVLGHSTAARNFGMKSNKQARWNDQFHIYWIEWLKDRITFNVDRSTYGTIYPPTNGFHTEKTNLGLPNADRWRVNANPIAPFDEWMYISIGVGVGGYNFRDRTDGSKSWKNNDPKAQKKFYNERKKWASTWNNASALEVDYVKVWAWE